MQGIRQVRKEVTITISQINNKSKKNSYSIDIIFRPIKERCSILVYITHPIIKPITLPNKDIVIPSIKISEKTFLFVNPRVLNIAKSYLRSLMLFNKVNSIPINDNEMISILK